MPGPRSVYQHFCPAARALEVVGEKWSLLIVRDLLAGPRRFSELRRSLVAITPRWLSQRLRELEGAGIVEREALGQREVWYRLTPKGEALAPVVGELVVWGMDHAAGPVRAGEAIHPGRATQGFVTYLNRRGVRLGQPVSWLVRFTDDRCYIIRFDGERWWSKRGEGPADIVVATSPEGWLAVLVGSPEERRRWLAESRIEGTPDRIAEFARTLERQEPAAKAAAGVTPVQAVR